MAMLAIVLTVLTFIAPSSAAICGEICRFRLCSPNEAEPDPKGRLIRLLQTGAIPNRPLICLTSLKDKVGFVKTGEPLVELPDLTTVPINTYKPPGLKKKFAKNFFLAKNEPEIILRRSGIAKRPLKANQWDFLDLLCIRLPVINYELVKGKKHPRKPRKIITTAGNPEDCVSFRTTTTRILVELLWNSDDDLELELTEPDAAPLNRANPKSPGKGILYPESVPACSGLRKTGQETAVYRARRDGKKGIFMKRGTYQYKVIHFKNCGNGPSQWILRVSINGQKLMSVGGTSNIDTNVVADQEIKSGSFEFNDPPGPSPSPKP